MQKDFTICLVKCVLFSFLTCFMILKDASSASGPQCEIICKLSGSAKDEETVDPDSKVPFNCSIENRGATTQNTTWKQLYRTVTPTDSQPCMVLKAGNSERQIYLARALTVAKPGSPKIIYENIGKNLSCEFEGRPRPFITWYIDGKSIMSEFEELSHTELETSQDDGIFKVTSTLYIPGREKFNGLSFTCSGTNRLSSGWSSSANETISVRFKCKDVIKANGPPETQVNAFTNITLRCLVSMEAAFFCQPGFTWHFNNNSEPLKTDGKYVIVEFEKIKSICKEAFSLEILNVTEDDEGEYSCHQACRTFNGWKNQSDSIKMKVYSPSPTTSALVIVSHSGSPKSISHNQGVDIHCAFKGRPRPQITWYKDDEPIINESESLSHEELEKSGEDGTLITSTTLHVPGREEFDGVYKCAANSRLNNSWSTSKNSKIQVIFLCKDVIKANGPPETQVNAFTNITLRCLVSMDAAFFCQGVFTWHFNNNSEPLKTDGKHVIVEFEKINSICKEAFSLEILNVTEDDEGEYSCHQACRTFNGWKNQSDSIKMKVYSPSPTTSALEITNRSGSPKYISQNQGVDIYCAFKGRSRPQITWYKDDEPIINESESLRHEELEKSGEDGTLTTLTILHVPGREEFDGFYKCAANSRFNNSWWTSKNSKIQVRFLCNKDTSIRPGTPLEIEENALKNIALSCLVRWDASDRCQGFAWHFKNNSVSLKTDEKYRIMEFEETDSICYNAYKLEITNVTGEDEGEYSCHQSCEDDVKGWLNSSVKFQLKVLSDISTTNDYTPASIPESTTVGGIFNTPQATSSEKWIPATVIPIVGVLVFVLLTVTWRIKKRRPYYHNTCSRLLEVTEENAF